MRSAIVALRMSGFKNEKWTEVRVVVPPDGVDAVSGFFFEWESLGVTEEEGTDPSRGAYVLLRAYFAEEALAARRAEFEAALRERLAAAGAGKTRIWVDEVLYGDWAEGWKQYFKPRKVGRRLVVAPTWEEYEPKGDELVVRVDPGMAFGTGQHETTSLCMQALEDLVVPGARVLDVGTGTGILAIAAVLLGAEGGLGVDNDPEAVTAARENVAANGLEDRLRMEDTPVEAVEGRYPLVVANILAEVLIVLAPALVARMEPGGALVLSGILAHLAPSVIEAYRAHGLPEPQVRRDGEWVCLVLRAP